VNALTRFRFQKIPFTRELSRDERLEFPHFDEAHDGLQRTVEQRMSAALLAPAGAGKTALLSRLKYTLPQTRYQVHYVKVTDLSKRDMCREIAAACGAEPAGSYPMLVRRLQERFEQTYTNEAIRPVLLLDEAHDVRPDVLGLLRILTNFEMDSRLVLSIVLAGQPPLGALLRHERLEDVAQRLNFCVTLRLLSRDETARYIEHRCAVAGAPTCPFSPETIEAIFEAGRGNLRATDRLALGALEHAAQLGFDVVSVPNVVAARKSLAP
jgi:type II secretory pathway predicted ATPase ExeA